jgi:hypothetical protein
MCWPSYPLFPVQGDLSGQLVQSDLSCLSCPYCRVPYVLYRLSCQGCPSVVFPSRMHCFRCPGLSVMFWPSCPYSPVLGVLSGLSSLAVVSCRVLFHLSDHSCSSLSGPVLDVISRLSCQGCLILVTFPSSPVLAVLFKLYSPHQNTEITHSLIINCPPLFISDHSDPAGGGFL